MARDPHELPDETLPEVEVTWAAEFGADERDAGEFMRESLEGYDLDEEDYALLADEDWDDEAPSGPALPVLAVLGRPNVGKSSLVNRIVGERVAVVQDVPGVTRDRVTYRASWAGREFTLVDTGGWEADVAGIDAAVARQAELALETCDAAVLVVDANTGITHTDEQIVRLLRSSKKPIILAANKVDSPLQESDAAVLWGLGLGEPHPISALHGRGMGDFLDVVLSVLPEESQVAAPSLDEGPRRVALLGRPNVGKSSLLNRLAQEERVVVNELAGTTRDPVDEIIYLDDEPWMFVDTAGIRRRVHLTRGADYYASLRTKAAIEKAELGLVLLDGSHNVTEQDIRVLQTVVDAGRALVLVVNKWDLVDEEQQALINASLERELVQMPWVERVNLSAKTGWHTNRLTRAMHTALEAWEKRIPTGKLNAFLGELAAAHPHPVRGGKQPRILFATQVSTRPPRIVIFASGFIEAPYRRFIERNLRETFGFTGTPIEISVRVREKRKKK